MQCVLDSWSVDATNFLSLAAATEFNLGMEESEPHRCPLCGKRLFRPLLLAHHLRNVHDVADAKIASCRRCRVFFRSHRAKRRHQLRVHACRPPSP
ncbi:Hypothetical predicted protein [Cloeon dipterum]|uniref:C2H2-type domain-containing protein n=1 Tax=Cloeon dipterum TaxID=197152 RepID=A0A8S1DPU7_9INSE|nr:Hypothetical predicted protein [Cloeon dipterum]